MHQETQILNLRDIADSPEWAGIQQLRIAFENSIVSLTANIICGFVIVLLLWPVSDQQGLIAWLGSICVITFMRLTLQQKFQRKNIGPAQYKLWRNAFVAGAALSGCAWGALSVMLFPADSILHQAYLTFILGGVCAGAVSPYAPQPGAFPAFCIPVLTPYGYAIWMTNDPESNLMATLVLAFMIILLRAARQAQGNVKDVLDLQVRNSDLTRALHHRATHDSLVDLVNHGEFNRRLKRIARSDRRHGGEYSMIFIDLDLFKEVNDTGGHAAGDEVLKAVAQILRQSSRGGDTAARVGGDEFALLLEGCPHDRAREIGEYIRREIAELRVLFEEEYYGVEASIGIAYGRSGVHSAEAMLRAADAACYSAKEDGRNRVVTHSAGDMFETTDRFEIAQSASGIE